MGARSWSQGVGVFLVSSVMTAGIGASGRALAADPTPAARAVAPGVVRIGPNTRSADIAALPPSQVLEFSSGKRLTVADVRSLAPLAARLRSMTGRGVLRQPLTGPTLRVTRQTERRQLETAPDATVLVAPDGRKITAGQFKAVLPHLQASSVRQAPIVKVARGTPLSELLKRPDTDVLESPGGKHVTVGELRRLAQSIPSGIRQ
ncbi:MAG: hypothetical protein WCC53_10690 [Thermoanaerobaculia bacterium]